MLALTRSAARLTAAATSRAAPPADSLLPPALCHTRRAQQPTARAMASGGGGGGAGAPTGAPVSISDRIVDDHRRFDSYINQLTGAGRTAEEREHLRHMLVHDLSVHSLGEEEVLYPAVKNAMGTELRDHVLDEHTRLKKILLDIDALHADDPAFLARLGDLQKELAHHVKEEEEELLPQFASKVDAAELGRLGDQFEDTKTKVPTRPHTWAPDKTITGNVVADRMTAPIDKLRDKVAGREVE